VNQLIILLVVFCISISNAYADVTKTRCMSVFGKSNINEVDNELLILAKRDAVEELFGSYVKSLTKVKNFSLQQDYVETYSAGLVRIKGNPEYSNTKNLERCIQINAFVTEKDLEKMQPKKLSKKTCEFGGVAKTLRKRTEEKAKLEALLDYAPNFKELPSSKVLPLLREVTFSDNGFVPETSCYCTKATGLIYPIELTVLQAEIKKPAVKQYVQGLKGEYFNLPPFSKSPGDFPKPSLKRIDKAINFEWGENAPAPNISADYFGVKWTGMIHITTTGTYLIRSSLDYFAGIKLSIDNNSVIESWNNCRDNHYACLAEANLYLEGNKWYPIKIEFFHVSKSASAKLFWRKPGDSSLEIIPATHFKTEKE